ncbi:MAG: hypothetical protein Q7S76_00045 [bacterium]|nr:hypothetical protein [bacterium]
MIQDTSITKKEIKQRVTAFVSPILVKRARVRGVLEGLTISEIIEKALDAYAPMIEQDIDQHIRIKFINIPTLDTPVPESDSKAVKIALRHTKHLVVPRKS